MSESLYDYLGRHRLLTVATASKAVIPHAASAFYVNDGTSLYFSTSPGSVTAKNLAENPFAAVVVADDPGNQPAEAKGVQITGTVVAVDGDEAARAAALFAERHPWLRDGGDTPYFRLDPHDVRYVDNSQSGHEQVHALGVDWNRQVVRRAFHRLQPDEYRRLAGHMRTETRRKDEVVIAEGERVDHLYVITDGRAEATRRDGTEHLILEPGSFVGELPIHEPATITVTALTDVTLVSIAESELEKLLSDVPELRRELEEAL